MPSVRSASFRLHKLCPLNIVKTDNKQTTRPRVKVPSPRLERGKIVRKIATWRPATFHVPRCWLRESGDLTSGGGEQHGAQPKQQTRIQRCMSTITATCVLCQIGTRTNTKRPKKEIATDKSRRVPRVLTTAAAVGSLLSSFAFVLRSRNARCSTVCGFAREKEK